MNITLSKNSRHFKIYSTVFSDIAPKSLCPYFWSWVLIVLWSPAILLIWIMKTLTGLFEKKPKSKKSVNNMTHDEFMVEVDKMNKRSEKTEMIGKIVFGVFLIFTGGITLLATYLQIQKDGLFVFLRNLFSIIGFLFCLYWVIVLITKNFKRIGELNVIKVPLAMIKAVYTKTCPIINWR